MKTHKLKLHIAFCNDVLSGIKTFEIRYDDRDYREGDLIEFIPVKNGGCPCTHDISKKKYKITYILHNIGLEEGYVAMAIREVKENEEKKMKCKYCIHNKICSTYVYVGDDGDICPYFAGKFQHIKLPCKVGDMVYVIDDRRGIVKCIVNEMHLGVNQEIYGDLFYYEQKADESPELVDVFDFDENDFGKTVFLTHEEAEKALKEIEKNEK